MPSEAMLCCCGSLPIGSSWPEIRYKAATAAMTQETTGQQGKGLEVQKRLVLVQCIAKGSDLGYLLPPGSADASMRKRL